MQSDTMYKEIEYIALALTLFVAGVIGIATQDLKMALSVLFGGALNIIGFRWIVVSSRSILNNANASKLAVLHFMIRYVSYGICMFLGVQVGLNLLCMLVGFLSINIAIKLHTLWKRKEG